MPGGFHKDRFQPIADIDLVEPCPIACSLLTVIKIPINYNILLQSDISTLPKVASSLLSNHPIRKPPFSISAVVVTVA